MLWGCPPVNSMHRNMRETLFFPSPALYYDVRYERGADISNSIPCESTGNWSSEPNIAPFLPVQSILATSLTRSPR